jgi:hypothetical protein
MALQIQAGHAYQIHRWEPAKKFARIYCTGIDDTYLKPRAFGVIVTVTDNGELLDTGDWALDGRFSDDGEGTLDLTADLGPIAEADDFVKSLRECRSILADLTGDDKTISFSNLYLRSVAAESRARMILNRAGKGA